MTNEELLVAMSDMMDEKIRRSMSDMMDEKIQRSMSDLMDAKLEPLKNDMTEVKDRVTNIEGQVVDLKNRVTNIEGQVADLKDRVTSIEVDMENVVKPGIVELCTAYHTEYEKYRIVNEDYDRMTSKVGAMETVVSEHSEQISEIRQVVGL